VCHRVSEIINKSYIKQSIHKGKKPQITIHVLYIITLQHVDCGIMYIHVQQNTPQITFHLLYIDTIKQVNCDIMYIQQSIPQITIHLYIDTLQQVQCDIMYIQQNTPQITFHLLYRHLTTGGL
jgi:hypothetical protein